MAIQVSDYKFGVSSFKVKVKGTAEVEAMIDKNQVKSSLLNMGSIEPAFILDAFPEVARVDINWSPFWFPMLSRLTGLKPRIDIVLK